MLYAWNNHILLLSLVQYFGIYTFYAAILIKQLIHQFSLMKWFQIFTIVPTSVISMLATVNSLWYSALILLLITIIRSNFLYLYIFVMVVPVLCSWFLFLTLQYFYTICKFSYIPAIPLEYSIFISVYFFMSFKRRIHYFRKTY